MKCKTDYKSRLMINDYMAFAILELGLGTRKRLVNLPSAQKKKKTWTNWWRFLPSSRMRNEQMHRNCWLWLCALQQSYVVSQDMTIRQWIKSIDTEVVDHRRTRRLTGPNELWHMEAYDQLNLHSIITTSGSIDGCSWYNVNFMHKKCVLVSRLNS